MNIDRLLNLLQNDGKLLDARTNCMNQHIPVVTLSCSYMCEKKKSQL